MLIQCDVVISIISMVVAFRRHVVGIDSNEVLDNYLITCVCSSKCSSKEVWQNSSHFITYTHSMAEATLNIDSI